MRRKQKKMRDGARLNPKRRDNGQSAAKPRIEEGSTIKVRASALKVVGTLRGEDMISTPLRGGGLYSRCGVTIRTKGTHRGLAKP